MNRLYLTALLAMLCSAGMTPATAQQRYTIDECRRMAVEENARIKTARNDLAGAEQSRKEAFTNYFPTVSLIGGAITTTDGVLQMAMGPQKMKLMEEGLAGGAMAALPVYGGGRIRNGNRLARLGQQVSAMQLEKTENEVLLAVEQYYWQIVVLNEKLRTVQQAEALLERIHTDAKAAVDAGIKNRNDLLQVELRYNDLRSTRLDIENNIAISKRLLAQHVGADPDDFDVASSLDGPVTAPVALRVDHTAALDATPEYRMLSSGVDAARLQKRMTLGEHLPSVAVGGAYVYNDLMGFSQNTVVGYVSVSIPISWKAPYSVKRRKYELENAQTRFEDGSEQLLIRMQKAWNDLTSAYEKILIAQESIEQSTENLRLNEDYYKAGTSSMSDLLNAESLYQQSRDKLIETKAQYEIKKTEYLQATGR